MGNRSRNGLTCLATTPRAPSGSIRAVRLSEQQQNIVSGIDVEEEMLQIARIR